jgi:DNA-directed RNA polymerase I, II, and III subunit RPABC1
MDKRIKQTLYELLSDRFYTNITEINEYTILAETPSQKIILVYIFTELKVGIKSIKNLQSLLEEYNCAHSIIVYRSNLTIFAKNALDEMNIEIEIFCEKEFYYNVTKHKLVPKHTLIESKQKIQQILDKYRCNLRNFPLLLKTDPVSRYYGFKSGSLIEITRNSETSGEYIHYRYVV